MLVAVFTMAACSMACEKSRKRSRLRLPKCTSPPVVQKDVPVYLELVGQTAGFQDVEIRARVEGFLETVNFREGSFVRQGDLLYEIDRKPLEAILAAGQGGPGDGRGAARKGQQRRRPLHAARGEAGGQQAGARQRAAPNRTRRGRRSRPPRPPSRRRRSISATRGSPRRSAGWSGPRRSSRATSSDAARARC